MLSHCIRNGPWTDARPLDLIQTALLLIWRIREWKNPRIAGWRSVRFKSAIIVLILGDLVGRDALVFERFLVAFTFSWRSASARRLFWRQRGLPPQGPEEDRDAVRAPQTDLEAGSAAITGLKRCSE
jgi:hypothetical protein